MTNDQPTQPLTDAELARIRDAYIKAQTVTNGLVGDPAGPYGRDCGGTAIRDVGRLLAEVDRLRAENARLRKQVQDYHESAIEHTAKFDRKHERLMEAQGRIDAARKALFDDAFEGHAQRYRALAHALKIDQSGEGQAKEAAPCARLHDTESKSAHVALNTVPMCFLADGHEAPHRCLCGKEWNNE